MAADPKDQFSITPSKRFLVSMTLVAALGSSVLLAACGGESNAPALAKTIKARFDHANFGDPAAGANHYLPVKPGEQWVRLGNTEVGGRKVPHEVTTTVTDVYRRIGGVRTVAMFDYERDSGQISQESIDWVAEDKNGNLWIVGGYTEEFEGGQYVSAVDAWLSGVNGAKAGIVVQGDPATGTPPYAVAKPGVDEGDIAQVVDVGVRHCVPFKCFGDTLVVREGKASAPDNELKYYARGVGQTDNVPHSDSVHKDVEQLVNQTQLSPRALAEASAEVLRLDQHAVKTAPDVYGKFPVARRG